MKCDLCEKDKKLIKFYWGFFQKDYEPEKWINVCENCSQKFIAASNIYAFDKTPLKEMEEEIKTKVRERTKKV